MKILILTDCYPPHLPYNEDQSCIGLVSALKTRGHEVKIITSTHGVDSIQADREIGRSLLLNGVHGHPLVTSYRALKPLESQNHGSVLQAIEQHSPAVLLVWTLHGLSKSLIFTLTHASVPVVYGVGDHWLSKELSSDPWLSWWHDRNPGPLKGIGRFFLEKGGGRNRIDRLAPTRPRAGMDRLPLFDHRYRGRFLEPNSISAFHFERIYFSSAHLKQTAEVAGFRVAEGRVIYPGIDTGHFFGDVKPQGQRIARFLTAGILDKSSGVKTILEALKWGQEHGFKWRLSVCGRGDSAFMAELRSFTIQYQLGVDYLTPPTRDLPNIYRQHDAFIHPAEGPEAFPHGALQAMACGLPVISTGLGPAGELLISGENALLYPPGDSQVLASRMQELEIQPALRVQMAERGQQEVQARHNQLTVADQIEQILLDAQNPAADGSF